jgi:hypothetical protein
MESLKNNLKKRVAEFDAANKELDEIRNNLSKLGFTEEAWTFSREIYEPATAKVSMLRVDVTSAVESITSLFGVTFYRDADAWGEMYEKLLAEARA